MSYPTLSTQHNSEPEIIYAKWRQRLPACNSKTNYPPYIDRYHVVIPPHKPLAVGQRVKILALSPRAYHAPNVRPLARSTTIYDTYDPQIQGRLLRVRAMAESTVEFVLDNETPEAAVVLAYIAIHHIPDHTTKLENVERVCKWATGNELDLHFIPLENAIIVHGPTTIGHWTTQAPIRTTQALTAAARPRTDDPPHAHGPEPESDGTGES